MKTILNQGIFYVIGTLAAEESKKAFYDKSS